MPIAFFVVNLKVTDDRPVVNRRCRVTPTASEGLGLGLTTLAAPPLNAARASQICL
jgi:hypothetical protein